MVGDAGSSPPRVPLDIKATRSMAAIKATRSKDVTWKGELIW